MRAAAEAEDADPREDQDDERQGRGLAAISAR